MLCDRIQEKVSAYHQAPSITKQRKTIGMDWETFHDSSEIEIQGETKQVKLRTGRESKQGQMLNQVDAIHPANRLLADSDDALFVS